MRYLDRPERNGNMQDLKPIDEGRNGAGNHKDRADGKGGCGDKEGCKVACRTTDPLARCRAPRAPQFEVGKEEGREQQREQEVYAAIGHQGCRHGVHWRAASNRVKDCDFEYTKTTGNVT